MARSSTACGIRPQAGDSVHRERKSHAIVQGNIGKFQNSFGMGNMVIIDNSKDDRELTTQIMDRCSKAVRRLLTNKIKSYTAKRWMATERRLKRR